MTFTLKEMLKEEDAKEFFEAMIKEIDDHSDGEHWEIINRSEMPRNARTILMI